MAFVVLIAQSVAMCFCILWLVAEEPLRVNEKYRSFPWYFISLKLGFSRFMKISMQYCGSRMLYLIMMCETLKYMWKNDEFSLCDKNNKLFCVLYQTSYTHTHTS